MSDRIDGSRRDLIKKGLALGSVGYVVPMILATATPASAQISGAGCSTATTDCEDPIPCSNGLSSDCACAPTVEGPVACIQTGDEGPGEPECCGDSGDCPSGWFCLDLSGLENCPFDDPCNGNPVQFCFPPCGVSANLP